MCLAFHPAVPLHPARNVPRTLRPRRHAPVKSARRTRMTAGPQPQPSPSPPNATHSASHAETQVAITSDRKLWTDQWYAIADIRDLRHATLHPVRLFDHPILLFIDAATGLPTALDDVCPHRAVKLSDGRLVDVAGVTTVECAYHGWRFSSGGVCTDRPATAAGERAPESCTVRRYAVETNPFGLVFVFFGDLVTANATALPGPSVLGPDVTAVPIYSRTLPISYGVLVENISDPSHVPFAHNGAGQGSRATFTRGRDMRITERDEKTGGFVLTITPASGPAGFEARLSCRGTTLIGGKPGTFADGEGDTQRKAEFVFHMTPVSRYETKLFNYAVIRDLPLVARFLIALKPRWLAHVKTHIILDGDTHILQHGEVILDGRGAGWRAYVSANGNLDASMAVWRAWLERHKVGMPFASPVRAREEMGKVIVNDRVRWHGCECVACSGALRNFRAGRLAALVTLAVAVAVMAGAAGVASAMGTAVGMQEATRRAMVTVRRTAVMALVAAAVAGGCQRGVESLTMTTTARKLYEGK